MFFSKIPYLILEIGSNHNGDFGLAKEMITAAAECGADAVKFQVYKAEELIHPTLMAKQFERCKSLEFTEEQWKELFSFCRDKKIDFSGSVFGDWGLKLVSNYCDWIKIASGDINHHSFLRKVGNVYKPVVLSTGMSTLDEISSALNTLGHNDVCLLHCMSLYPCPSEEANLDFITKLRSRFENEVGYSDHCVGIDVAIWSLQYLPSVLEKHFTLTPNLLTGDHVHSATPDMVSRLVIRIKNIFRVCSKDSSVNFYNRGDMVNKSKWRRGVYIKEKKESQIRENDLLIVRPEEGCFCKANDYYALVGG